MSDRMLNNEIYYDSDGARQCVKTTFAPSFPETEWDSIHIDETYPWEIEGKEYLLEWLVKLYGDYVKVEFGPGRIAALDMRSHVTIGLNRSADYFCDIYTDLEFGIPLPDESVDEIYSNQFLEHISRDNFIFFMNEQWRVLKPGGFMVHSVPTWDSPWAFADPTHKNWFQPKSFDYFSVGADGTPFVDVFSDYGIKGVFKTSMKVRPRVDITVRMVKPK